MDFFEAQRAARKKSRIIVWYLLGAVIVSALASYLVLGLVIFLFTSFAVARWDWQVFATIAGGTVALVGFGSLYKIIRLRKGGKAVAQMLGAKPVTPGTAELDQQILLNVVEEIAIASGLPVPDVYLLDEDPGINALAAGFTTTDAVIVVTRGCTELLTRDELQGVVAHEFSHILNGDMRLNLRLMGVLHGILLIHLHGKQIVDEDRFHPAKVLGIIGGLMGMGLIVIGSAGQFCARLIRAAVSRQRELLADAAAVQFTRYPAGLADALKKIGGTEPHVGNSSAEEASHMFFADAMRLRGGGSARPARKPTLAGAFRELLSTHPELEERILRLDPSFDGTFPEANRVDRTENDLRDRQRAQKREAGQVHQGNESMAFSPGEAIAHVGMPAQEHLRFAAALVSSFPDELVTKVRDSSGVVPLSYALLFSDDEHSRQAQLDVLTNHADDSLREEAVKAYQMVRELRPGAHLPLAEMAQPALRKLSPNQFFSFHDKVRRLVEADRKFSLFEFVLQRILVEGVRPHFEAVDTDRIRHHRLGPLLPACDQLLSALARAGHDNESDAADAFTQAARLLGPGNRKPEILPEDPAEFEKVDAALDLLGGAAPAIKQRVLHSCATCVGADGFVTVQESEMLRVIALSLQCPMSPLHAGDADVPDEGATTTIEPDAVATPLQDCRDRLPGNSRRWHRTAVLIVWCVALLAAAGGGLLFYVSHGYANARREIERLGGEWVEESYSGASTKPELGPYVSASIAGETLNDEGLRRLAPWLPFLARFYKPLRLNIADSQVTDDGIAALRGNKYLRSLDLGGTQATDRGVAMLLECPNLESLSLQSNPRITDESLVAVGKLRRLRSLDLGTTAITDKGLAHLEPLPEIQYVRLWGTAVTAAGIYRLKEMHPALQIKYYGLCQRQAR